MCPQRLFCVVLVALHLLHKLSVADIPSSPHIALHSSDTKQDLGLGWAESNQRQKEVHSVSDYGKDVYSVSDYGATGNGILYDTVAIQRTIDSCARAGGGLVVFPPGSYLTGTIFLKSGVTLQVAEGATILGSPSQQDYPEDASRWYLILAEDADEVGISGGGVIDGQGLKFVTEFKEEKNIMVSWNQTGACSGDECRPRLVGFLNCTNVRIGKIHLREPAYWCIHVVLCNHVTIEDVDIYGDFNCPNNDGIDIEGSNNTSIQRVHIDTGDDAICPKTSRGPLTNLTVTDCWIRTKSSAVKLGSGSVYDFTNLHFEKLLIEDSHRGLAVQLRDSGSVRNVTFANIKLSTRYYDPSWWGRAEPIYVTACAREAATPGVGSVQGVRFVNISATSENGIFLAGATDSLLNGLNFENVSVRLERSTTYPGGKHDYRPGCQGLVDFDGTAGIFMEYVQDATFSEMDITWTPDASLGWGSPLQFNPSSVVNLSLNQFHSHY